MGGSVIPSASEEFFKILKELRRADPVEQLMIAGVRQMNFAAQFILQHGLHYLTVADEAEAHCMKKTKSGGVFLDKQCVVKYVEDKTGDPIEAVTGALRALRQMVLSIVIHSPNVRTLIYKSGEYILAGGMPEIRYLIGGRVSARPKIEEL